MSTPSLGNGIRGEYISDWNYSIDNFVELSLYYVGALATQNISSMLDVDSFSGLSWITAQATMENRLNYF